MGTAPLRVLCTGGEGTGTKLMTRLVTQMGAEGIHLSFPYDGVWPTLPEFDVAIVMVRDWWAAAASQENAGYVESRERALDVNLPCAYSELIYQLTVSGRPWRMVVYCSLVARPKTVVRNVANWLNLDTRGVTERIHDKNKRWLRSVSVSH